LVEDGVIPGICDSGRVSAQQDVDEAFLAAETSQQSEIDVPGHARFTPPLDGDASNETRTPALPVAEA
jgi:hypothetical protein